MTQKKKMIRNPFWVQTFGVYDRSGIGDSGGGFPVSTPGRRRWLLMTPKGAHARIRYRARDSLNTTVGGVCMKE